MSIARWERVGTEGLPIVALHTWVHESEKYAALSKALGEQTIYSIFPPEPGVDTLPRRVPEWVDHHEAVLRTLDLEPPYHLVGWSFGGVVAVELARRLHAAGVPVSYVGLLDTIRPRLLPLDTREYIWYHLGAAAAMPEPERLPYLRQKAAFLAVRTFPRAGATLRRTLYALGYRRGRAVKHSEKPTDPRMISVHTSYLNYRGDPVPFPVHLYATAGSVARAKEPALRWLSSLHGGYTIADVPGAHFTMFDEPHVEGLAAAIARDLRSLPDVEHHVDHPESRTG